jgi:prepilin-type N-terminal cleavage/methylation domain-containing protein
LKSWPHLAAQEEKGMFENGNENGFTLIELLITVAILGILAMVAFSQVAEYRKKGSNSAALSDLRNLKLILETFYANNHTYP